MLARGAAVRASAPGQAVDLRATQATGCLPRERPITHINSCKSSASPTKPEYEARTTEVPAAPRRSAHRPVGSSTAEPERTPARLHSSSARTKAHPVQGFRVGGWAAGGSLSSRKQTLKRCILRLLSFPQGRYTRCFIRPDVQISVSAHPARNTAAVICPPSTRGAEERL